MKFLRESLHSIFPGRFRSRESLNGNFLSSREAFPEAAALLLILIKSEFHEEEKKKEEEGEKRGRGEEGRGGERRGWKRRRSRRVALYGTQRSFEEYA
uniref:Uncharacterized protein n=1 Tax=Vespula pensylvanica TaxID=30213 RepID=A0A834KHL1_VESPE|nr:hypothetical protein H0235_014870 [Vespula pensylvanica]